MSNPTDELHADLGFKPLSATWAKAEILLGLVAATAGVVGSIRLAVSEIMRPLTPVEHLYYVYGTLIVLGGYLALAGQRSHLYQSNNKLAAQLNTQLISEASPVA